jgi:hypothetical protein
MKEKNSTIMTLKVILEEQEDAPAVYKLVLYDEWFYEVVSIGFAENIFMLKRLQKKFPRIELMKILTDAILEKIDDDFCDRYRDKYDEDDED